MKINPNLGKPMNTEEYAHHWSKDSKFLDQNSQYKWMTEQLGSAELIIEVGCGAGYSTYALARNPNRKILVIEVNAILLDQASKYLTSKNISFDIATTPEEITEKLKHSNIVFLNTNIFDIEPQLKTLTQRFDAIICWLIGAEPLVISKNIKKELEDFKNSDMATYRENVHKVCYKLGESLLKPEGVCHIVDRSIIASWNTKDKARLDAVAHHKELSSEKYTVNFANTFLRKSGDIRQSKINYIVQEDMPYDLGLPVIISVRAIKN